LDGDGDVESEGVTPADAVPEKEPWKKTRYMLQISYIWFAEA